MKETKSNWECVTDTLMQEDQFINLGQQASSSLRKNPMEMIDYLSYYKFASKLIKKEKKILSINCQEGLGTYILGKECGFALGLDTNQEAIKHAQQMFPENCADFSCNDFVNFSSEKKDWDAIVSYNMDRHLSLEETQKLFQHVSSYLYLEGLSIISMKNPLLDQTSDFFYSFKEVVQKYFDPLFTFSLNDGVILPSMLPHTRNIILVGCKKI